MRKGRDGEKRGVEKRERNGGKKREKTDDYSGHYIIASSRPLERRPLERRPLVPKYCILPCADRVLDLSLMPCAP